MEKITGCSIILNHRGKSFVRPKNKTPPLKWKGLDYEGREIFYTKGKVYDEGKLFEYDDWCEGKELEGFRESHILKAPPVKVYHPIMELHRRWKYG